jgi:hypothetical protein
MLSTLTLLAQIANPQFDTTAVNAIRTAAEREPVEAFAGAPGFVRVLQVAWLDVNGDGKPEAFVAVAPKYRQTPTILVYSYDAQHGATRVYEGLAPGRLEPVSGQFIDDHTLGYGIDMTIGSDGQAVDFDGVLAAGVRHHMSIMRYKTFFHTDERAGFITFVDLSDRALPSSTTTTCESFEFSPLTGLAAGPLSGSHKPYLVALTSDDITIYVFHGIRANGTLDKKSWVRARPADVAGLTVATNGDVVLATRDGRTLPIAAP